MGAYYQVALSEVETFEREKTVILENNSLKFLETFYAINYQAKEVYERIKNYTLKHGKGLFIATACDYDKYSRNNPHIYDCVTPTKAVDIPNKGSEKYSRAEFARLRIDGGIFICDETKQYFDFGKIIETVVNDTNINHYYISPLHLLTRKIKSGQGGGDFGVICLGFSCFTSNMGKTSKLVASWYGKQVRYQDDNLGLDGYADITDAITVYEKI